MSTATATASTAGVTPTARAADHLATSSASGMMSRMDSLGPRLKELRRGAGLSLRELARQAEVSASLVSQIENGKSRPSVASLYTFARVLSVPVDDLFEAAGVDPAGTDPHGPSAQGPATGAAAAAAGGGAPAVGETDPANAWRPSEYATRISVVHPTHRAHLEMADGVDWERLAATPERDVNFMKITYAPGAASTAGGGLISHEGYEYGYVTSGTVEVTVGQEVFVLSPGESLGFDSSIPHVLRNTGTEVFEGIWFVHGSHHR